jgi:autoinducer 2-degrading protein
MNKKQYFIVLLANLLLAWEALCVSAQSVQQTPLVGQKDIYAILFRVEVKTAKRQVFINFMEWDCQMVSEHEPQTLRFDVLEDPENKNIFYVYEAYQNQQAFEEHKKMPLFSIGLLVLRMRS